MRTVPSPVTCERHWAGKQSGLCQDSPPLSLPRDAGRGKEEGRGEGRGGREVWPQEPQSRGPGNHARQPPCCCLVQRSRVQAADGRGQEPTPGSAAPQPGAAFHQDTISGLQWPRAKPSGRNPGCLCVGHTGPQRSGQRPEAAPAPAASRARVHEQSHSRSSDSRGRRAGSRQGSSHPGRSAERVEAHGILCPPSAEHQA